MAAIPAPIMTLTGAADGRLLLTVTPPPGVRSLTLRLSPQAAARLEGVAGASTDFALPAGRWSRVDWSAPPPEGLALRLRPGAARALELRYALVLDSWPPGVAPPKPPPPDVMSGGLSGEAQVTGSRRLTW
jgi:hypothetical protein